MISRAVIDRINALARKQRTTGLSASEQAEQANLRRQYVEYIKEQVKAQLDARFPHSAVRRYGCHQHEHRSCRH